MNIKTPAEATAATMTPHRLLTVQKRVLLARVPCLQPGQSSPITPQGPRQMVQLQSTPTQFSLNDMRLFHHFLLRAYPHLPLGADQTWINVVPAFAHHVSRPHQKNAIYSQCSVRFPHTCNASIVCISPQRNNNRGSIKRCFVTSRRCGK